MRIRLPLILLCGLTLPAPASAATFVVRGAGFGHGVGMSQYGAYGYAEHGWKHDRILRAYYSGTQLADAGPRPAVRVLLQGGRSSYVVRGAAKAGDVALDRSRSYRVSAGGVTTTGGAHVSGSSRVAAPPGGSLLLRGTSVPGVRDGRYRGAIEVRGGLAINHVGLEDYLRGVVPRESPASWPQEALRAQAIAARTYALTTSKASSQGYDQFADVRSQVYGGVGAETPATDEAVRATAGRIVVRDGRPVTTFFFSTSGGHTEDVENVFSRDLALPWLRGVIDPFDDVSPRHRWRIAMPMRSAAAKLHGLYRGAFRGIRVVARGASPRIVRAQVLGSAGNGVATGSTLRARLGLHDSWASFTVKRRAGQRENPAPRGKGAPRPADGTGGSGAGAGGVGPG